jgi:hypothetical protein
MKQLACGWFIEWNLVVSKIGRLFSIYNTFYDLKSKPRNISSKTGGQNLFVTIQRVVYPFSLQYFVIP